MLREKYCAFVGLLLLLEQADALQARTHSASYRGYRYRTLLRFSSHSQRRRRLVAAAPLLYCSKQQCKNSKLKIKPHTHTQTPLLLVYLGFA